MHRMQAMRPGNVGIAFTAILWGRLLRAYLPSAACIRRENHACRPHGHDCWRIDRPDLYIHTHASPCYCTQKSPMHTNEMHVYLNTHTDVHTIASSAWPWPFDPRVNACRATATRCAYTKFGVDSSSRFSFLSSDTHRHTKSQTPLITVPTRLLPQAREITK